MKNVLVKPWFYKSAPVIIWFLMLILPFLSSPGNIPAQQQHKFLVNVFISNLLLLGIFYLHTYQLYRLLERNYLAWYTFWLIVVVGLYLTYWFFLADIPPVPFPARADGGPQIPAGKFRLMPILSPMIALLCSFCYRVLLDNAIREQRIKDRETIHLTTELNFLRSQISPHFMFNTLNNLAALARKKSELLEPAIINLSHIMRYMIYESDDNRVPLDKEIIYLKNYIDLQLLRFGDKVKVTMNVTGDTDRVMIEPMLLIPFVVNAFKHGTGMINHPLILIGMEVRNAGSIFQFKVVNAVNPSDRSKDSASGIGLTNVQRRLAILYPDQHKLKISSQENSFATDLVINFK